VSPVVLPYKPAAHKLHTAEPPTLYWPAAHLTAVAFVEPVGQKYPALQFPLHALVVSPETLPYKPAAHKLHDDQPLKLYWPAAHRTAVEFVEPSGQ
jgi:hypothetical protein